MGNERRERLQLDFHRQRAVLECDVRQRISPGEGRCVQPAEPRRIVRTQPILTLIGRKDARLQHSRHRLRITGLCPDRRKCIRGRVAFIRAVEDLPIAQLSAAAQRHAARRHAAQRKGNHLQLGPGKDPREYRVLLSRGRSNRCLALRHLAERGPCSHLRSRAERPRGLFEKCAPRQRIVFRHQFPLLWLDLSVLLSARHSPLPLARKQRMPLSKFSTMGCCCLSPALFMLT